MKMPNIGLFLVLFCGTLVSLVGSTHTASAQSRFHISLTAGYEMTNGYAPGYDLTILYQGLWGARYMILPDVELTEDTELIQGSDSIAAVSVEGDLEIPMVLKTIDYRSFGDGNAIGLDFITAYVGLGYNQIKADLIQKQYTSSGGTFSLKESRMSVNVPVSALVMGLYMGERFVALDGKLLYIRGDIESGDSVAGKMPFDHWLIQLSAGIFF